MVLYVPKAPRKEQLFLNILKRVDERKITLNIPKLYILKRPQMARGPRIPPRLTEPTVISPVPQSQMKDPKTVPYNYNKPVVTYKGKEIAGDVNEMTRSERYYTPDKLKKAKQVGTIKCHRRNLLAMKKMRNS